MAPAGMQHPGMDGATQGWLWLTQAQAALGASGLERVCGHADVILPPQPAAGAQHHDGGGG